MLKRLMALLVLLFIAVPAAFSADDDISRLYTFTPGTTIQSSQMNAEFNQLITTMNGKMSRAGVNTVSGANTFSGNNTFSGENTFSNATSPIKTDLIKEYTPAAGVTIDGLLLKDGILRPTVTADPTPTEGDFWYNSTSNVLKYYDGSATKTVATAGLPTKYMNGPPVAYVSASQVKIPSGFMARSSDDTTDMVAASDLTCDLTVSGAGGLDASSEASGTWYYPYMVEDPSTDTEACLLSTVNEASSGSVTLPTGYTKKRQLPIAIRNDGSSNIIPFYVADWGLRPVVRYQVTGPLEGVAGTLSVLSGGTSTSYADINLASFVPPISKEALMAIMNNGTNRTVFRADGDTFSGYSFSATNGNSIGWVPTSSTQVIEYKQVSSASGSVYVDVAGYRVTEVN